MLIVLIGLVLTAVLLVKLGSWNANHAAELGTMSDSWMAAYQASRHASSI
jgi:hypothetical protein